jgi:hypothetical protein
MLRSRPKLCMLYMYITAPFILRHGLWWALVLPRTPRIVSQSVHRYSQLRCDLINVDESQGGKKDYASPRVLQSYVTYGKVRGLSAYGIPRILLAICTRRTNCHVLSRPPKLQLTSTSRSNVLGELAIISCSHLLGLYDLETMTVQVFESKLKTHRML